MDACIIFPKTLRTFLGVATALACLLTSYEGRSATTLIQRQSAWRFLDDGSNQGVNWRYPWYDDDAWGFGRAELGYGDNLDGRPETTVISGGPDSNNHYITTYFRRVFYADEPENFSTLTIRLLRDDGGIVYINGTEVFRSGMPDGTVNATTLATPGTSGVDETIFFNGSINPQFLVNGLNLIAVEIHQNLPWSSDLSFDLELVADEPVNPPAASLVRGPYLQSGTPTNILVRWRTEDRAPGKVQFGLSPGALSWSVENSDTETEHSLSLTNLAPDTKYYYAIVAGTQVLSSGADHHFITSPATQKPTRIWAIGDAGTSSANSFGQWDVRDAYYTFAGDRHTDVWLMLGDNAYYEGTDLEYQTAVFDTYPALLRTTPVWSTMGNHETYSVEPNGIHAYFGAFNFPTAGQAGGEPSGTEHYYSFNYGNIHFVCLDSEESARTPGGPMLTWLEEDLSANTRDWTIAFWHSPPYTKGSHDSDNLFDNGGNMAQMRQNIVPILESYGVDLVLCGHSHNYERSYLMNGHYGFSSSLTAEMKLDEGSGRADETGPYRKPSTGPGANEGTVYIVAGSSGWATSQTGRHPIMHSALLVKGSLVLDIDGHRLDAKFLRETGAIDDYFTILKGGASDPVRIANFHHDGGNITARWNSRAGKTYRVEQTTSLETPDWNPVSTDILASGTTTSWTGGTASPVNRKFFRVRQLD